jgi:hypothetical protein
MSISSISSSISNSTIESSDGYVVEHDDHQSQSSSGGVGNSFDAVLLPAHQDRGGSGCSSTTSSADSAMNSVPADLPASCSSSDDDHHDENQEFESGDARGYHDTVTSSSSALQRSPLLWALLLPLLPPSLIQMCVESRCLLRSSNVLRMYSCTCRAAAVAARCEATWQVEA